MKAIVISLIARLFVIIAVLGFTFAMCYVNENNNFLWLLFLLLIVEFIPIYKYNTIHQPKQEDTTK